MRGYFLEIRFTDNDFLSVETIMEAENQTRAIMVAQSHLPPGHQISIVRVKEVTSGVILKQTPRELVPVGTIRATEIRA